MIQPCGVEFLDRLGVLGGILAAGAVPLTQFTLVNEDVQIQTALDEAVFRRPVLCVRRVTLDTLLVDVAGEAGAEVRTGLRATRLATDGDRVTGIETDRGLIRAQLVVGADGRHSTVAALAGAQEYHVTAPGRMVAWAYYEGVKEQAACARMGRIGEFSFLAGPTDGDLYMVALPTSFAHQTDFRAHRDSKFDSGIRAWPELADTVASGRRIGPIRLVTKWHGYFRQSAGPGWVLVGDAGHFKDPAPGQGMSDAFRQAERLAEAIEAGFGNSDVESATQSWWRWRDRDGYGMYWLARDMGTPGALTPLSIRLFRNIFADPDTANTFLRVLNHEVRPSELLTRQMLVRAAAQAIRDEPEQTIATLKEIIAAGLERARRARDRKAAWNGNNGAKNTRQLEARF
jgi:2-polyprenyl-6-methoxyphenol hydroxylase-like FAD-dependent oxidoreductase